MAESQYEKYVVRKPIYEAVTGVKNRQSPSMTFMSRQQVPEVNSYIELGWIYGIPRPNPYVHEHVHDYDEIILHWGGRYETPQDLGAEIEFYIGGQPITTLISRAPANKATEIFVKMYAKMEIIVIVQRQPALKRFSRYSGIVKTRLPR